MYADESDAWARPDPHAAAVYRMEGREFAGHFLQVTPWKQLRARVRALSRIYDVPRPTVVPLWHDARAGLYWHLHHRIELNPDHGRSLLVLAHEFAHHIAWVRHGWHVQSHGPTWLLYYAQCLATLRIMPVAGMKEAAKRHGLTMASIK